MNKVILIGNLGKDPEVRYLDSGDCVCNFSLATSEKWKDKNGEQQERTEWHRIVAWRKLGETCGRYLSKGRQVCIEGKIQTRKYVKDDRDVYATDIVAHNMEFIGSKNQADGDYKPQQEQKSATADDDLPF